MAQEQVEQLKRQLQKAQSQFQNYKTQCKQYEQFLEKESNKKQQQIKKLKEQAIKRQKNYNLLKTQVSQLETENATLKAEVSQFNELKANTKPTVDKSQQYLKQIQQLKKKNEQLLSESQQYKKKIEILQKKLDQQSKSVSKSKTESKAESGDNKKLQQALANSKSKVNELQKQVDKLKQELSKKHSIKQSKSEQKKIQKQIHRDHKEEQRLKQKIQKLQRKVSQSQFHANKSQQTNNKLTKQIKQLKGKISSVQIQKQALNKRIKQLMNSSSKKKQQKVMKQQNEEYEQNKQQIKQTNGLTNLGNLFSALILTKKHYVSPFLQFKSDNSVRIYKNTKNGSFQKSLGSIKYKLNEINYNVQEIMEKCARVVKEDINSCVKSSIILFGPKKTTKKYLLANLITKLKDFLIQKISQSEQELQGLFISASPDPQKRIQMHAHNKQQLELIFNKIIDNAQKSPKKIQSSKIKAQPRPKARCFKIIQGQLYLQIITTSFTNFQLRQNLTPTEALNNIAYSRLPNALQPTDCHRQVILILNPIVSLYEQCKNTLSITNCKNTGEPEVSDFQMRNSAIKQELLNDTARKKIQNCERQSEQYLIKMKKQEEDIQYYRTKFDELQLRLKNLLNTHRQQNSYLKKSPVTLSYEKMLKFVHSVQAKNNQTPVTTNYTEQTNKNNEQNYEEGENEYLHEVNENEDGEDIL